MQLLPKDEKFYDLLLEQSQIVKDAARLLLEGARQHDQIGELEKRGDQAIREVYDRLNRTFITPIDPEDIGAVTVALEELLDGIEALAFRLSAYHVDPVPPVVNAVTTKLTAAADKIHEVFQVLHDKEMKGKEEIRGKCQEIRQLASECIHSVRESVVELYDRERDCATLMKVREIYEHLELCARECERFTDVVQNVVAKNM